MKKNDGTKKIYLFAACCILFSCFLTAGCSSVDRQKSEPSAREEAELTVPQKELTAEEIAAMTPEELKKYHEERQKIRMKQAEIQRRKRLRQMQQERSARGQELVNSFMPDRPSREKRRRLGDVSRQLEYSEGTIFPWRGSRRSEALLDR